MRKLLIEARKSRGHTQRTLAKEIGISSVGYSLIERGERDGSVETWRSIFKALGVPKRDAWPMIDQK